MALDKLLDSAQLDADLSSVAAAIRTKGGTSAQLAFPSGFVGAIGDLPTDGGQSVTLLASGTFTKTDASTVNSRVDIPVSFSGTPVQVFVYAPTPVSGVSQTYRWAWQAEVAEEIEDCFGFQLSRCVYKTANGIPGSAPATVSFESDGTVLRCGQQSSSYHVQDNTYNWFVWGYEA